ncbi:hypothetical protein HZA75_01820 [Candidatus Roizmanbacteria bacterium]|nr:hypothetical protein [Candidatus Roizmanbacteria bacterium]
MKEKVAAIVEDKPWVVFLFFILVIFITFKIVFSYYFAADEWVHFTYYFPLLKKPDGFFTAFISTFINTGFLTGEGQHINPIGTVIFFLNTKFFGLYYPPYVFMTLSLHAFNSFLIFLLLKIFLSKKASLEKNMFALLSGLFFALAPTPVHTLTGAVPFYSYNVLSVTFSLLCIISFKIAYIRKKKKFIYSSIIFLFSALFSKETTSFLFFLLPLMAFLEKRVFALKFLGKLFIASVIIYIFLRFFIPDISGFVFNQMLQPTKSFDNGTIVSTDTSIYPNLPVEILFRTITFPLRMVGTVFVPRETVFSVVKFFTPVVVPVPPGGDIAGRLSFGYGAGNFVLIYLISIAIIIFCVQRIRIFLRMKQLEDARILALGFAIIILSALPLIAIIFSFPRWGYDFYFDSRHYYNPTVGAAIVFPFLVVGIASLIAKIIRFKSVMWISFGLAVVWIIYTTQLLYTSLMGEANKYSSDRREVAEQIKKELPVLPQKTVFFMETDSLSAYGPVLPFETSVPQALSLIYYDKNPLPDIIFNKTILDGKPEGYQYAAGRGLGYYKFKKSLADALWEKQFAVNDVYSFYYEAKKIKLNDTTVTTRNEMRKYLEERKAFANWETFISTPSATETVTFLYPPSMEIVDNPIATDEAKILKNIQINDMQLNVNLKIISITPTFDINELTNNWGKMNDTQITTKKLFFDTYHFNDALIVNADGSQYYLIKFDDLLLSLKIATDVPSSIETIEKILGSVAVVNKK